MVGDQVFQHGVEGRLGPEGVTSRVFVGTDLRGPSLCEVVATTESSGMILRSGPDRDVKDDWDVWWRRRRRERDLLDFVGSP